MSSLGELHAAGGVYRFRRPPRYFAAQRVEDAQNLAGGILFLVTINDRGKTTLTEVRKCAVPSDFQRLVAMAQLGTDPTTILEAVL